MKNDLEQLLAACVQRVFSVDAEIDLSRPEEKFGDYATNVALQLAKELGKPPREIAEALAADVRTNASDIVTEVSVAGPGFLNLRLSDQALIAAAAPQVTKTATGAEVVIETNNPNPFKAMHIGHAFNAILGDTLANLLEAAGNHTHRVSYHGDVGAHVGKSMWALLQYVDGDPTKLASIPAEQRNGFMSEMYAKGAKAYKDDETVKQQVDQLGEESFTLDDPIYKQVYEICKDWSFELLDATIARLGCQPTPKKYMESQADAMGVDTVKAHVGTVFQESDGALIFHGEDYGSFTNVFVSSRGRGLYAARDLGLMQLKQADFHPTKSYIVTAEEQRSYFVGVIKAAELCLPELNGVTVNISTGTVKLATGKMSSRDGKVLDIAWLFDQVEQAIVARGGQADPQVVIGALRYEFLKVRIGSDVVFDVGEAVSITGNSGPYLQYAHARAKSVLAKAESEVKGSFDLAQNDKLQADERSFVRKLSEYTEAAERAMQELLPHHICTYLYELAQTFNRFYEHNRVIGDARQDVRLALVAQYAETLRTGLNLLGIPAPDRM